MTTDGSDVWKSVVAYHERTKHHYHRFARSLGYLDWATQPDPFRRFAGSRLIPLSFWRGEDGPAYHDLFVAGAVRAQPVSLSSIAILFELSLGLSAWKEFRGSRWALRMNPSSGNLHPTEGYLVLGPLAGLSEAAGVYHYVPKEHALEERAVFSAQRWDSFRAGAPRGAFLVGLSSIHWREAWKYGERAYRYCQEDAGHAMGAISLAAAVLGWKAYLLDEPEDREVQAWLGLSRDEDFGGAEREDPDGLIAVVPEGDDAMHEVPRFDFSIIADIAKTASWTGRANRLSKDHVHWPIIDEVALACAKDGHAQGTGTFPSDDRENNRSVPGGASAPAIIRQRRSAVDFDGKTSISAEQFHHMMGRVLPGDRPPWNTLGPPVCVHLGLFVHLVDGLEPGLYALVRAPDRLNELRAAMNDSFDWADPPGCPKRLPLYRLASGDARRLAAQVSCGQEIAGDSAFSLGMIAEFEKPLREFGAWFYRRLHWECGAIGQVLYLEAEAAGVRGTGIGCYFDDPVHEVFGLSGTSYQSLYHFTVGGPVEDDRLTTLPPYSASMISSRPPITLS